MRITSLVLACILACSVKYPFDMTINLGKGILRSCSYVDCAVTISWTAWLPTLPFESFDFYFKPAVGAHFSFLLKQKFSQNSYINLMMKIGGYSFKTKKIIGEINRTKDDYIDYNLDDRYLLLPADLTGGTDWLKQINANPITYSIGFGFNF